MSQESSIDYVKCAICGKDIDDCGSDCEFEDEEHCGDNQCKMCNDFFGTFGGPDAKE